MFTPCCPTTSVSEPIQRAYQWSTVTKRKAQARMPSRGAKRAPEPVEGRTKIDCACFWKLNMCNSNAGITFVRFMSVTCNRAAVKTEAASTRTTQAALIEAYIVTHSGRSSGLLGSNDGPDNFLSFAFCGRLTCSRGITRVRARGRLEVCRVDLETSCVTACTSKLSFGKPVIEFVCAVTLFCSRLEEVNVFCRHALQIRLSLLSDCPRCVLVGIVPRLILQQRNLIIFALSNDATQNISPLQIRYPVAPH
mmetsp:Transcript_54009/g.99412  ORF Transcript_54009/g.99412 Transcript_54009/m.99412 type:complete len:251 (+) Transcript_54009:332-1084(+)